ncbi:MAG: hypothetical protein J5784_00795 [Muribaculaceae bacterium]|nr:hypothetical protein [Muribaculaceae bacterium]MBR5435651.1 hypothetical protein [Muribaculaceae bacterium]
MNTIIASIQTDFPPSGNYIIINADITLSENTTIGNVFLEFQGGQINLNGHILTFDGTTIIAPDYKLFIGSLDNIEGFLANAEINADWFGAAEWHNVIAPVNKAFGLCKDDAIVVLPQRRYYLEDKIVISEKGRGLKCPGRIVYEYNQNGSNPDCALELQTDQLRIDICSLECNLTGNGMSGVLFSGNVHNSDINIGRILLFDKGLNFSPTLFTEEFHEEKDTNNNIIMVPTYSAGSQYNKIRWQIINCDIGLFINLWATNPSVVQEHTYTNGNQTIIAKHKVWVNENYFLGGRINANFGILTDHSSESAFSNFDPDDEYHIDKNNGNVFENVSFEGITNCAVNLYKTQLCRFYNIRMPSNLSGITHLIALDKCAFIDFHFKGYFNPRYLSATHSTGIKVDALIVDDNYSLIAEDAYLEVVSQNPTAFETNPCSKFVARRRNAISALTQRAFSATQTINLLDLFGSTQVGDTVLTDECDITVAENVTLTTETSGIVRTICPKLLIKATVGLNSRILFSLNGNIVNSISNNGSYIISFLYNTNNLQIIQL